ncbi:MAG: hypothetical protein ACTTK0_05685 [Stomatobaculum sp.]
MNTYRCIVNGVVVQVTVQCVDREKASSEAAVNHVDYMASKTTRKQATWVAAKRVSHLPFR